MTFSRRINHQTRHSPQHTFDGIIYCIVCVRQPIWDHLDLSIPSCMQHMVLLDHLHL